MTESEIEEHFAAIEREHRDLFRAYDQHAPNPTFAVHRDDLADFVAGAESVLTLQLLPIVIKIVADDPRGRTTCFCVG